MRVPFSAVLLLLVGCSGTTADDASSRRESPLQQGDAVVAHRLVLRLIDRDGHPPESASVKIVDLATAETSFEQNVAGGHLELELPAGRYGVGGVIATPRPGAERPSITIAHVGDLELAGPVERTLDARAGKRVAVSIDEASAKQKKGTVFVAQPTQKGNVQFPTFPPPIDAFEKDEVLAVPTESVKGLVFYVQSTWSQGGLDDTPYVYHLLSRAEGHVPREPSFRVRKSELARVQVDLAAQGVDWNQGTAYSSSTPDLDLIGLRVSLGAGARVALPSTRIDYYTPGAWTSDLRLGLVSAGLDFAAAHLDYARAGHDHLAWNGAPVGPSFPAGSAFYSSPSREGDSLSVSIPMYTDAAGHYNLPRPTVTGSMVLRRNGEIVAENGDVGDLGRGATLAPERAIYELTSHGKRDVPWSHYATEQTVVWQFSSEHTQARTALPLLALRCTPKLDRDGRAEGGTVSTFEVRVERNPGAPLGAVREVGLSVSFDDGQHWEPAHVVGTGDRWRAIVRYSENADFVSLRAVARDDRGNSVSQTLLRAYGLKRR